MTSLSKLVAIGLLLTLPPRLIAQEKATVVNLVVKHDGKEKPAPDHVTLSFDEHSVQIPVRDSRFEVPPEFVSAQNVTFAVDVEGAHILVSNLSGTLFMAENWTLLLAERRYDEGYRSAVPKGAVVRRSCILVFESPEMDPSRVVFCSGCRTKDK
jgi:hypothetical protein